MKKSILPSYCYSGRKLVDVGGVIIHYLSARNVDSENMFSVDACWRLLLDLNRAKEDREWFMKGSKWPDHRMFASAHYLIDRDGEVLQIMDLDKQAYHAGVSILNGRSGCNAWTLGIELLGHQNSSFSQAQYKALSRLLIELEETYGFSRDNIAGHDTIRHAAIQKGMSTRHKYDPSGRKDGKGDNFDWFYLGKMMNDIKENPEGVVGIESLDAVIEADPLSH